MRWGVVVLGLLMLVMVGKATAVHVTITDQSIKVEGVDILTGKDIGIQEDGIVVSGIKHDFTVHGLMYDPTSALSILIGTLDTENATKLCERLPSYTDAQIFEKIDPKVSARIADNLSPDKLFEILNDQNLSIQKGNEITFYMSNKSNIKLGGRIGFLYDDFNDNSITDRDPTVPSNASKIYRWFRPKWEVLSGSVNVSDGKLKFPSTGAKVKLPIELKYGVKTTFTVYNGGDNVVGEIRFYLPYVYGMKWFYWYYDSSKDSGGCRYHTFYCDPTYKDYCYDVFIKSIKFYPPENEVWAVKIDWFKDEQGYIRSVAYISIKSTTYRGQFELAVPPTGYFIIEVTGGNHTRWIDNLCIDI